jgi:CheY-like chemotaxis protein
MENIPAWREDIRFRIDADNRAVQVMKRLRELWGNEMPALVLTGDTAPEVLQDIHASGAMLLHKPIAQPAFASYDAFSLHGES